MFLNRDPSDQAKETMNEYMRIAQQKKQAQVQGRIEQLAEEKRETKANDQQMEDMRATEKEMRLSQIQNNIKAYDQVKRQRDTQKQMEKEHDKKYGFNHFPFTHGEELEKARAEHKEAFRAEVRAMRQLKEAQEQADMESYKPPSTLPEDDDKSGIANPLIKS